MKHRSLPRTVVTAEWLKRPTRVRETAVQTKAELCQCFHSGYRLVGLVVKASSSRAEDPGAWRYRVSAGTGVCVLGLVGPVSVYCDWVRWRV